VGGFRPAAKGGIMSKKTFIILTACIVSFLFSAPYAGAQGKNDVANFHVQKGLEFYNKGFYEFAPKSQQEEARQNYDLAASEFQKAISANPSSEEAHRNLARVYYVQKKFEDAAREYKKVTELNPSDIDSHVLLALTLTKIDKFDEAIAELQNAKNRTTDENILEKLNGYIQKIEQNR
jgi:tetratricopeptide (TPR) repeat protein